MDNDESFSKYPLIFIFLKESRCLSDEYFDPLI
jgi:hypothetical protein